MFYPLDTLRRSSFLAIENMFICKIGAGWKRKELGVKGPQPVGLSYAGCCDQCPVKLNRHLERNVFAPPHFVLGI